MLVTIGVTAAVFAIGELLLSLPASRIPHAEAEELVDEALEDFSAKEEKRELDEILKMFQLERSLTGDAFTPVAYLLRFPADLPEGMELRKQLAEAKEAAERGDSYEFTCLPARVFFRMTEQQQRRKKK
jgi:hypothetical protein